VVTCLERGADCLHVVLPHLNPDWFYLSGTGYVMQKRPLHGCRTDDEANAYFPRQIHRQIFAQFTAAYDKISNLG